MGGHNIAENVIRRRYGKGIRNFFDLYQPIADYWSVYDNSESGKSLLVAQGNKRATMDIYQPDLWISFCEAAK